MIEKITKRIERVQDLDVYQLAFDVAMEIFVAICTFSEKALAKARLEAERARWRQGMSSVTGSSFAPAANACLCARLLDPPEERGGAELQKAVRSALRHPLPPSEAGSRARTFSLGKSERRLSQWPEAENRQTAEIFEILRINSYYLLSFIHRPSYV